MTEAKGQFGFIVGGSIVFVLALAIMFIMISLYFRSAGNNESPAQTGQKAIEDAEKTSNQLLQQQQEQIDLQNEINSISY